LSVAQAYRRLCLSCASSVGREKDQSSKAAEIQEDLHPVGRMSSARVIVGCHWTEVFATFATVTAIGAASVSLRKQSRFRDIQCLLSMASGRRLRTVWVELHPGHFYAARFTKSETPPAPPTRVRVHHERVNVCYSALPLTTTTTSTITTYCFSTF